jgi:hypothetical protein
VRGQRHRGAAPRAAAPPPRAGSAPRRRPMGLPHALSSSSRRGARPAPRTADAHGSPGVARTRADAWRAPPLEAQERRAARAHNLQHWIISSWHISRKLHPPRPPGPASSLRERIGGPGRFRPPLAPPRASTDSRHHLRRFAGCSPRASGGAPFHALGHAQHCWPGHGRPAAVGAGGRHQPGPPRLPVRSALAGAAGRGAAADPPAGQLRRARSRRAGTPPRGPAHAR